MTKGLLPTGSPYGSMDLSGNITICHPDGSAMSQMEIDQMVAAAGVESSIFNALLEPQQRDYLKNMIKSHASTAEESVLVDSLFDAMLSNTDDSDEK